MVESGSSLLYKGVPKYKNTSLMRLTVRDCGLTKSNVIVCVLILEIYVHYVHHSAPTQPPIHFDVQIKTSPKFSGVSVGDWQLCDRNGVLISEVYHI